MIELYDCACALDEVSIGLDRSIITASMVFSDFDETAKMYAPEDIEVFEQYNQALQLVIDRLMQEKAKLDVLSEKVFAVFQKTKAGDEHE